MDWKSALLTAVVVIVALIAYDMVVKRFLPASYEEFEAAE